MLQKAISVVRCCFFIICHFCYKMKMYTIQDKQLPFPQGEKAQNNPMTMLLSLTTMSSIAASG